MFSSWQSWECLNWKNSKFVLYHKNKNSQLNTSFERQEASCIISGCLQTWLINHPSSCLWSALFKTDGLHLNITEAQMMSENMDSSLGVWRVGDEGNTVTHLMAFPKDAVISYHRPGSTPYWCDLLTLKTWFLAPLPKSFVGYVWVFDCFLK